MEEWTRRSPSIWRATFSRSLIPIAVHTETRLCTASGGGWKPHLSCCTLEPCGSDSADWKMEAADLKKTALSDVLELELFLALRNGRSERCSKFPDSLIQWVRAATALVNSRHGPQSRKRWFRSWRAWERRHISRSPLDGQQPTRFTRGFSTG